MPAPSRVQYAPAAPCQPVVGLISAEDRRQVSIGDTEDVLEMRWIYCCRVLKPALKDRFSLGEYLAERRNSGPI